MSNYIQVLADFMGDSVTIKSAYPGVSVTVGRLTSHVECPTMSFFRGHWYARLPGDSRAFDPYDEFQIPKSNQFCQTYCLMYLTGTLPIPDPTNSPNKYYRYTREALAYMRTLTESLPSSGPAFKGDTTLGPRRTKRHIIKCIDECLEKSHMCVDLTRTC